MTREVYVNGPTKIRGSAANLLDLEFEVTGNVTENQVREYNENDPLVAPDIMGSVITENITKSKTKVIRDGHTGPTTEPNIPYATGSPKSDAEWEDDPLIAPEMPWGRGTEEQYQPLSLGGRPMTKVGEDEDDFTREQEARWMEKKMATVLFGQLPFIL